ncbi:MAG: YlxR family protein [Desulforhopalus sp.]
MTTGPQRTCCICKTKRAKRELHRFVWKHDAVEADPEQLLQGRGAYCCDNEKCLQLFQRKKKKWKRLFRL